jgi:hypothetical protein
MKNDLTMGMLRQITEELQSTAKQTGNNLPPAASTLPSAIPLNWWKNSPAESPEEIAKLTKVLSYLSSDAPRGQGSFYDAADQPNEENWLAVVWAIASLGWSGGKEIARNWSTPSSRYTEDGFEQAWSAYKANHHKAIGIGSLYKRAKELGWQSPQAAPVAHNANRYKLLGRNEIMALNPLAWLVKGIFPATGLASMFGPTGSGKSFLGFDCAAAVAEGVPWFDFKTNACPVVYAALEGEAGYRLRVEAWEKQNGRHLPSNLSLILQPFKLTDPQDVADLAAVVPQGAAIFVDTLNRASPTSDENSSKDMGEILEGAKRLQELTGGLVVLIAHTGKDTSKGVRGHSSLFAALDAAIEVERNTNGRSWSVAKAKDSTDGQGFPFKLKVHDLGKDADGDPLTSCTVERSYGQLFQTPEPSGKAQKLALKLIKAEIAQSKETNKAGSGKSAQCLKFEDAVTNIAGTLTTVVANKRRNRARAILNSLNDGGHINTGLDVGDESWLWLP